MDGLGPVAPADFAFYYPGHIWREAGWVKNLLLFFDGLALLVPEYKLHEPEHMHPDLAGPLRDRGMLEYLTADEIVDGRATKQLADAMYAVISSGALDKLAEERTAFHHISYSRLGSYGDAQLADAIHAELKKRGLAQDSKDGHSIPMHPKVRVLVLVLLSQILRPYGLRRHIELAPATDRPELVNALGELLAVRPPGVAPVDVIQFDLDTVGVDLSDVPIDEVLAFRGEHFDAHRAYARQVRDSARVLSLLPPDVRREAFDDREAEIRDLAADLKRISRRAWKRPTVFALSLAGAAWAGFSGNIVGAVLSAMSALLTGAKAGDTGDAGAYSYLFKANLTLPE